MSQAPKTGTRHLLLVDPDPAAAALAAFDALDVTAVETLVAARAYLAGSAFDAVAVRADLDPADTLGALAAGLGVAGGVIRYDATELLAGAVGARLGLVRSADIAPSGGTEPGAAGPNVRPDALAELRDEIGRVAHDLANPLAVIAGNAQLGSEIARATASDAAVAQAFADIGEAAAELDRRIAALAALRRHVDALMHAG